MNKSKRIQCRRAAQDDVGALTLTLCESRRRCEEAKGTSTAHRWSSQCSCLLFFFLRGKRNLFRGTLPSCHKSCWPQKPNLRAAACEEAHREGVSCSYVLPNTMVCSLCLSTTKAFKIKPPRPELNITIIQLNGELSVALLP